MEVASLSFFKSLYLNRVQIVHTMLSHGVLVILAQFTGGKNEVLRWGP